MSRYCREKGEMHWAERVESGLRTEIGTSECVNARLKIGSVILNRNGSYTAALFLGAVEKRTQFGASAAEQDAYRASFFFFFFFFPRG